MFLLMLLYSESLNQMSNDRFVVYPFNQQNTFSTVRIVNKKNYQSDKSQIVCAIIVSKNIFWQIFRGHKTKFFFDLHSTILSDLDDFVFGIHISCPIHGCTHISVFIAIDSELKLGKSAILVGQQPTSNDKMSS